MISPCTPLTPLRQRFERVGYVSSNTVVIASYLSCVEPIQDYVKTARGQQGIKIYTHLNMLILANPDSQCCLVARNDIF
jgi:hypothetical protein